VIHIDIELIQIDTSLILILWVWV